MWLIVHSLLVTGLSAAVFCGADVALIAGALAAEGGLAFLFLFAEGGVPAKRLANAVTGIRLAVGAASLAAVAASVGPPTITAMVLFWALVVGEGTDFADGLVARRLGPTAFGARLDMETDAFFMLVLCIVVVAWGFPRWIVVAGFLRYAVALPFFLLPEPRFPRLFSTFAKTASASGAVALLVVAYPHTPEILQILGGWLAVGLLAISFGWETAVRVAAAVRIQPALPKQTASGRRGMVRSFLTYYGIPFRLFRMKKLYRVFVQPGDLVMDVGAHVGNRVRALRSLGTRVIAIEPQSACVRLLGSLYGRDPDVTVVPVACGAHGGQASLRVDPGHPTLATLSDEWIDAIDRHYGDLNINWDHSEVVTVRTLDDLIGEFGRPCFIKIDVEGFEAEALRGLTIPVRTISFEFLPASPGSALAGLDEIGRIGSYKFNYSMVESMQLASTRWLSADEMGEVVSRMAPADRSGDVYATLREPGE